jgi:hypothetical protein
LEQNLIKYQTLTRLNIDEIQETAKIIKSTPTPKNKIFKREAKGGGLWSYVKSNHFEDLLDGYYPGWSFMLNGESKIVGKEGNGFVYTPVRLIIHDHGAQRIIDDIGGAEVKYYSKGDKSGDYLDFPNDVKASITDGFKRCCYRLGMARDIKYDAADMNISEDQHQLLMWALEHASDKFKEKIQKMVDEEVNQANFNNFLKKSILPVLEQKDKAKFEELTKKLNVKVK